MAKMTNAMILDGLKHGAALSVASFPQYRGHFVNYVLCHVKVAVRTKTGKAFEAGEVAICSPAPRPCFPGEVKFLTVWSKRNRVDTSVAASDVEIL